MYRQSEKKLVKQQYLPHMSLQYGELRSTSGWDRFVILGHPSKFQRVSRLGSVTARHSPSGRQPNCGVEQRAARVFGRAAITFGIGPHSTLLCFMLVLNAQRGMLSVRVFVCHTDEWPYCNHCRSLTGRDYGAISDDLEWPWDHFTYGKLSEWMQLIIQLYSYCSSSLYTCNDNFTDYCCKPKRSYTVA